MTSGRVWFRRLGASVCAGVLVLAGCGDNGDGDGDNGADSPGPLAEFFGWDDQRAGGEEFTEEQRQQHYEVQEYIVECMSEAGFEYTPEPFWGDREDAPGQGPNEEIWQLQQDDPEKFAREYGYGITTVETGDGVATPETASPEDDPNLEYRESLSDAAREEYEKALWGDWESVEDEEWEEGDEPVMPDPPGCQNEAWQEVSGFGQGEEQERFQDIQEEMSALNERIENDARLVEVTDAWSSCMADAGHPGLTSLWEGQEKVTERQNELYDWEGRGEGRGEGTASAAPDQTPDAGASPPVPAEPDPAKLAEIREFELDIAWADYTCKEEHDVEQVQREVRFELEEQFIEEHREELEEYRDWTNERRGVG